MTRRGMRRAFTALRRSETGSASVEFAFGSIIILTLLMGTVEFGRYFYLRNGLAYAVQEAGRYAARTANVTDSQIGAVVTTNTPTGITAAVTYATTTSGSVTLKTITATATVPFVTQILPMASLVAQSSTTVPIN